MSNSYLSTRLWCLLVCYRHYGPGVLDALSHPAHMVSRAGRMYAKHQGVAFYIVQGHWRLIFDLS